MSLKGKRIVVVGGSAGIGKATAQAALEAGAHVVIASRSEEQLREARAALGPVETCAFDVRDTRAMDHCFAQIGAFDHLVITAAEITAGAFIETDLDEARKTIDTKFWGPFLTAQAALPYLTEAGSITLFSGVTAHRPVRGLSVVAAANGAVEALTRSLAYELCPLRVNAVCPGFVDTHEMDDERRTALAASLPVGRVGQAEDIAQAVLFLMQNPYTTGTILRIDGGKMIN